MKAMIVLLVLITVFIIVIFLVLHVRKQKRLKEEEEAERYYALREEAEKKEKERIESLKKTNLTAYFKEMMDNAIDGLVYESLFEDSEFEPKVKVVLYNGILGIETLLPNPEEIGIKGYSEKTGEPLKWTKNDNFPKKYEDALFTICLQTIDYAFSIDSPKPLIGILYNGYVDAHNPRNGRLQHNLVLSLFVTNEQFSEIDIEHIDPKACFKSLKGVSAAKLIDITPVNPVLTLDKHDRRFVDSHCISVNTGTNIAAMDWQEFEHLVRQVLELEFSKNGGEVRVTQASRDGGVDAIIFDPDPLRGGKIVVQAKRYTNTVGVSAVRDLYGTVINEGASSGILITTSDYGPDSYDFAKDKPLKLLNSGHLMGLLQRNGIQGYINIAEAKAILSKQDKQ